MIVRPIVTENEALQAGLAHIAAARRAHTETLQQTLYETPSRLPFNVRAEHLKQMIRDFLSG